MIKIKKIYINPQTKKEWWIEIKENCFTTCLNNGKIKEAVCVNDKELKNKSIRAIMAQMRKGFFYSNSNAKFAEATAHVFISKVYTGFMPIAARTDKDDFYICRTIGNFDDEILYHFGKYGNKFSQSSLGQGRLTYNLVWNCDDTLYLNNLHQIECFTPKTASLSYIAGSTNCFNSALDASGLYTLYYIPNKKEFVVYDLAKNQCVWSKVIISKSKKETLSCNYCCARLSETGNRLLYKPETETYIIVDLNSKKETIIKNEAQDCFFSPDDKYLNIGGITYETESGNIIQNNPFPFDVTKDSLEVSTCGSLMAVRYIRYNGSSSPIQLFDYKTSQLLATIDDPFVVKRAEFTLAKSTLILHTDYGVLSIYNCER